MRTADTGTSYRRSVAAQELGAAGRTIVKGPLRDRSLGTKLSEVEYARVESAALSAGVGLSEWCRNAVLRAAAPDGSAPEAALMAELLALRAVLLNVVYRMANGER